MTEWSIQPVSDTMLKIGAREWEEEQHITYDFYMENPVTHWKNDGERIPSTALLRKRFYILLHNPHHKRTN